VLITGDGGRVKLTAAVGGGEGSALDWKKKSAVKQYSIRGRIETLLWKRAGCCSREEHSFWYPSGDKGGRERGDFGTRAD